MKKLATVAAFAALLCFASGAFAQSTAQGKVSSMVLSQTPASMMILAFGPSGHGGHAGGDQWGNGNRNGNGNGNGNGCGSQDWGWGQGGGCNQVPEGGETFTYLALAGLFCFGAAIFKVRQQSPVNRADSKA